MSQKYEDAVKRARELYDSGNSLTKMQISIIFPEEFVKSKDEEMLDQVMESYDAVEAYIGDNEAIRDEMKQGILRQLEDQRGWIRNLAKHMCKWTPSRQQMDGLECAISLLKESGHLAVGGVLDSILCNLKIMKNGEE